MAGVHNALNDKKTIFIVPFKAISEVKFSDFTEKYASLGFRIVISDHDHHEHDDQIKVGDYEIAILRWYLQYRFSSLCCSMC
jgi:replicative superfamily II helicase